MFRGIESLIAVAVVLCLLTKETQPMPATETECDTPIIPTNTATTLPPPPIRVCGSLTRAEAGAFTQSNIQPTLDRIIHSANTVFNHSSLSYIPVS